MNTKHFDYFITIAETRNLSHAARRLGVSQPVLSRYLADLEQELNVKLFYHENRRLHITVAGQIYLNGVKRMKELKAQMLRSFDSLQHNKELTLRLGMSPFRGGHELASFYPKLLDRYPSLNLIITEGNSQELLEKLYRRELSAILNLYDASQMPHTKIATLTKSEVLVVLPNYHPLAGFSNSSASKPATLTVQQLCSLTDVLFVYLGSPTILGQVIEQACLRYEFAPQTLLRTCNSIAISSLLASGSYAGFLLQETAETMTDLIYFRFPHPLYLYSGLIFSDEHQPDEIEQYLYWLKYQQVKVATPNLLYVNDLGKRLLNSIHTGPMGGIE